MLAGVPRTHIDRAGFCIHVFSDPSQAPHVHSVFTCMCIYVYRQRERKTRTRNLPKDGQGRTLCLSGACQAAHESSLNESCASGRLYMNTSYISFCNTIEVYVHVRMCYACMLHVDLHSSLCMSVCIGITCTDGYATTRTDVVIGRRAHTPCVCLML